MTDVLWVLFGALTAVTLFAAALGISNLLAILGHQPGGEY